MNRRWINAVLVLTIGACVFAESKLTKIADRVYAYVGSANPAPASGYGVNVGVIVGDNAILIVDTHTSAKAGQQLVNDIKAISDKPIKWVVNTHPHFDHVLGNCVFVKLGATIIGQDDCLADMKANGQTMVENISKYVMPAGEMTGTEIACPAMTFSKDVMIDLGAITVELHYFGPAHCRGNCIVYLPAQKIIFTGDILFTDFHPYMGAGNIESWKNVLDEIGKMDADKIIPGHGPVSGKKDLVEMKTYIGLFDQYAKELVQSAAKPIDADALVEQMKIKLPQRTHFAEVIKTNLMQKYLPQETNKTDKK